MTLSIEQAAINLASAVALSSVIGFERQWHNPLAGLRTNTLVALGAATFVVFSDIVPGEGSPTRIAAQVVSGTEIDTLDYGPFRVATGTMGYKHREADLRQVKTSLEAPNFLLNIIPHVDGTPRICELVEYRLEDIVLRGAWTGPAALSLAPHALAPVAELPVREIVSAIHIVADLTLGLGRVDLQRPIRQSLPIGEEGLAT